MTYISAASAILIVLIFLALGVIVFLAMYLLWPQRKDFEFD